MRSSRNTRSSAIVGVLLLGTGCTSGGDTEATDAAHGDCRSPAPVANTPDLPPALDLDSFATVTEVVRDDGFVNATATAQGTIRDIHERFSRSVRRSGYSIVGSENEVIEADVYFARGSDTTGAAKFIQTSCPGQVRIQMFLGTPK